MGKLGRIDQDSIPKNMCSAGTKLTLASESLSLNRAGEQQHFIDFKERCDVWR